MLLNGFGFSGYRNFADELVKILLMMLIGKP